VGCTTGERDGPWVGEETTYSVVRTGGYVLVIPRGFHVSDLMALSVRLAVMVVVATRVVVIYPTVS
jgi:hypothetical protein